MACASRRTAGWKSPSVLAQGRVLHRHNNIAAFSNFGPAFGSALFLCPLPGERAVLMVDEGDPAGSLACGQQVGDVLRARPWRQRRAAAAHVARNPARADREECPAAGAVARGDAAQAHVERGLAHAVGLITAAIVLRDAAEPG